MRIAAAALVCAVVVAVGAVLVSGGSDADPRTPPALPGLSAPFLGTTVTGDGGLTAALDAYGDVVDLRAPGPAGAALIDDPASRQAAGTVPADTGIVPRVRFADEPSSPMWRAESVAQRYLRGTNVVRTVARFAKGAVRVEMTTATSGDALAMEIRVIAPPPPDFGSAPPRPIAVPSVSLDLQGGIRCARETRGPQLDVDCRAGRVGPPVPGAAVKGAVARSSARVVRAATAEGRRWLAASKPLGAGMRAKRATDHTSAPRWAKAMYERSLLTIHALTSRQTGAVAAGARDGWAYVWPRDAATAALALDAAGHPREARRIARFLTGLDLNAAARFDESGAPVPGRAAQGDAAGWIAAAARATHVRPADEPFPWRDRADYQESSPGTYLGNALSATHGKASTARILRRFGNADGLFRSAGDPTSGLDSAAGWAVRPFELHPLYPAAEKTLLRLVHGRTRYGITPGEGWRGGEDPWMAPTAWSAWALAALPGRAPRRAALGLLADLRRAATPAGALPERVGAHTGIPTSTTPLLWASAFAVLALRELWP